MKNREFLTWMIGSLLFGSVVTSLYISMKQKVKIREYKMQHFKDSLEMEYYKKELESYPFEHSKIPTDGK